MITAHDKWKCVKRELKLRNSAYPRLVGDGRMTHREARHQLDVMAAIVEDYRQLAEKEDEETRLL